MRLRHTRTAAPLAAAVALAFSGTAIADTTTGTTPGTPPGAGPTTGQNGSGMSTNNGRHCGWWRGRGHHGHHGHHFRPLTGRGCPPQAGGPGMTTGGAIGTPTPAPRPTTRPTTNPCPSGTTTSSGTRDPDAYGGGDRDDCTPTTSGGTTQGAGCPTGTGTPYGSSDDRDGDDCGTTPSSGGANCTNGHGGYGGRD